MQFFLGVHRCWMFLKWNIGKQYTFQCCLPPLCMNRTPKDTSVLGCSTYQILLVLQTVQSSSNGSHNKQGRQPFCEAQTLSLPIASRRYKDPRPWPHAPYKHREHTRIMLQICIPGKVPSQPGGASLARYILSGMFDCFSHILVAFGCCHVRPFLACSTPCFLSCSAFDFALTSPPRRALLQI